MLDAVFLDRDGTLIEDPGYLSDPADVVLLPGAADAVRALNEAGIRAIVITNQSGIGRGYYSEADFRAVQAELERQLAERGARLDDVYFCPHDPESDSCECRKPGTALFCRAAREHGLRLHRSLLIGDRERDVEPAGELGASAILVAGGDGRYDEGAPVDIPRRADLFEAIRDALRTERQLSQPANVAVFVSGSGTNLQALLDRFHGGSAGEARVSRVIASRPGIGAIARAESAGVPWSVLPAGVNSAGLADAMLEELEAAQADIVVLAGFLKLVPESVVRAYRGRILNIHPALLPSFGGPGMYGRRVHEAVINSGARISGATVHVVDEEYDHGAIVAQWPVPVLEGDTAESLAARILTVEHRLLPDVVAALAAGDLVTDQAGRPEWKRPLYASERFVLGPNTS
jgi:formyltetrahydrofolate-dependent phosphoribosylglycinamide formyltransferase